MFVNRISHKYLHTIQALVDLKIFPRILLSILCQSPEQYSLRSFLLPDNDLTDEASYLSHLSALTVIPIISYSAVSTYVMSITSEFADLNAINGVNRILWDGPVDRTSVENVTYGVKHIWDHYNYGHIHVISTYENHRIISLNAIKRTWLSALSITAGLKKQNTRVSYAYFNEGMLPPYTREQYYHLAKLNYATVIQPPYSYARTALLSLNEIESIALSTTNCYEITPTLNIAYITAMQLGQERILGNNPILSRCKIVTPLVFEDNLVLYKRFNTKQLPLGPEFDVDNLLLKVETQHTVARPEYLINMPVADHYVYKNPITRHRPTSLRQKEYTAFLDQLRLQSQSQYRPRNIMDTVASNGINIIVSTLAELAVASTSLNKGNAGANLNKSDDILSAVIELTDAPYIMDYYMSMGLVNELLLFREILNIDLSSMNVTIISPEVAPVTFTKICKVSNVTCNVYSRDGSIGSEIISLYSFDIMSSNMLFITITEIEFLRDFSSYQLFISELRVYTYYSIEFLDFDNTNLTLAIQSILQALRLVLQKQDVKVLFQPLLLNTLCVGVRVVFSLIDIPYISTTYAQNDLLDLECYTRTITPKKVVIDPIKSLTYRNEIIPRMGTHITLTCQPSMYNESLGYMSSICRYTTSKSYSELYTFCTIEGFVDQSRIALLDRLKMFRKNDLIKSEQLLPQEFTFNTSDKVGRLTPFELVSQTDRMLLYIIRREEGSLVNDISDYGSAHFLNLCMTDNNYTMYDLDPIVVPDIPGIDFIETVLRWNQPLPYIIDNDVLIYNSIFMNATVTDTDMATPLINMLTPVTPANNIYFNLPYMTEGLFNLLSVLGIVSEKDNRYYLKMAEYPSIPCLTPDELARVLAIFPAPQYEIKACVPTLLDYYFTSRMIQRSANLQVYYNAIMIHQCLPFFHIVKQ